MKNVLLIIDMQNDFLLPDGKLSIFPEDSETGFDKRMLEVEDLVGNVIGAEFKLKAKDEDLKIVKTLDFHMPDDKELSDKPDFKTTFPPHCMAGSFGAENVEGLKADLPNFVPHYEFDPTMTLKLDFSLNEFVLSKDEFSVWEGNPNTESVFSEISDESTTFWVTGVTTQICVHQAIVGLGGMRPNNPIKVIKDCIAPIPGIPLEPIYDQWKSLGVELIGLNEIK